MLKLCKKMLRNISREQSGSMFVIVAFSAMAIVGAVGVAVDIGRSQMVQAKLQNSVDAAGLAAGATVSTEDLTDVATKYVNLNFKQGNLGATLNSVEAVLSNNKKILTVDASATIPTTIMKIFGRDTVEVKAHTEVTRSNKGLELAIVLDTTGSMKGSKLTALKNASHDLLDILYGDGTNNQNLWVGVVPFAHSVNIGPSRTNWLNASHFAGLDFTPETWAGCVDERWSTNRDTTDDPPYDLANPVANPTAPYERLKAYFWKDESDNDWIRTNTVNTSLCSNKSSCTCTNYGPCTTTTSNGVTTAITCTGTGSSRSCNKAVTSNYDITPERGPNAYCPSAITPMTNDKATVEAGVDALVALGATHVNVGAVWGWRMLSPRWRGYWGGDMNTNNLPLNYKAPLMSKAVIIMTDGENTTYSNVRTAYDKPSVSSIDATKLNTKTTAVCNAMKAQGIIVYTILFDETSTTITNLMKNCATNPDYFFNSPTEEALKSAFQTIGDSLANLRISR